MSSAIATGVMCRLAAGCFYDDEGFVFAPLDVEHNVSSL
jgi:hypothetical protein